MTIEEAKRYLGCLVGDGSVEFVMAPIKTEVLCMAMAALEKQMPKKPLHVHKNHYCPICKEDGWMLWDDAIPNELDSYCGKCGQRLDWSDVEREAT